LNASYILPIRADRQDEELTPYLHWLADQLEVVAVDGSPEPVFLAHHGSWPSSIQHLRPAVDTANGKVGAVLTGLQVASNELLIVADDDVRYDRDSLQRMVEELQKFDVVRPQNYYSAWPWVARADTARTLLNRVFGGDWPGTLGVRRSLLIRAGGYDGAALFENLELVRTVLASGGKESAPLDFFIRRLPPDCGRFLSQRVRQAYDEFARPRRLVLQASLLPLGLLAVLEGYWSTLIVAALCSIGLAEMGRLRGGGRRVFPASASVFAPAWLVERAGCIWLALGARLLFGGVSYRGRRLKLAAHSVKELRSRLHERVPA
jgi:hypothetical protein